MAGFSIPAAEHSTITSWGRDGEVDAYRNMLTNFARPGSIVAVVSDSYDVFNACENLWGGELKQQIIDSGATLVIRPDSGDPEAICVKVIQILDKKFGHTVNAKGYKVLNNVRIIQGDGVNESVIRCILGHYAVLGYSADNIAFGMGGALLQGIDRDTQKFAMKCSAIEVVRGTAHFDGQYMYPDVVEEWIDVQKDPITDPGKKSKAGRVQLWVNEDGEYASSVGLPGWTDKGRGGWRPALKEVFRDGKLLKDYTFDEVRANSNK
jgi:nicotinamide phosphoribosyltransferase